MGSSSRQRRARAKACRQSLWQRATPEWTTLPRSTLLAYRSQSAARVADVLAAPDPSDASAGTANSLELRVATLESRLQTLAGDLNEAAHRQLEAIQAQVRQLSDQVIPVMLQHAKQLQEAIASLTESVQEVSKAQGDLVTWASQDRSAVQQLAMKLGRLEESVRELGTPTHTPQHRCDQPLQTKQTASAGRLPPLQRPPPTDSRSTVDDEPADPAFHKGPSQHDGCVRLGRELDRARPNREDCHASGDHPHSSTSGEHPHRHHGDTWQAEAWTSAGDQRSQQQDTRGADFCDSRWSASGDPATHSEDQGCSSEAEERLRALLHEVLDMPCAEAQALVAGADRSLRCLSLEVAAFEDYDLVAVGLAARILERCTLPTGVPLRRSHEWQRHLTPGLRNEVTRTLEHILQASRTRADRWRHTAEAFSTFAGLLERIWKSPWADRFP